VSRATGRRRCSRRGALALALVPWGSGTPAALSWVVEGVHPKWPAFDARVALGPFVAASIVALFCAWSGRERLTVGACLLAIAWVFGAALVAGTSGPSWGWGACLSLPLPHACAVARARAARRVPPRPDVASIVVRDRAAARAVRLLSRRQVADRGGARSAGPLRRRAAAERLFTADIWGLGCLGGGTRCGVAINSALLAPIVGVLSTLLGLVLRARRAARRQALLGLLQLMSLLPSITPPFVLALALVVLFGRTGLSPAGSKRFRHSRARAGSTACPASTIAQLLTFAPIAFMILHGALRAISPALEEAAQTLRASRGRVFRTVTWPLLRRRSPPRSCSASSRASPTSATRSCSPATSRCSRPRSSSPSPARSTTRAAPRAGVGAARAHARRVLAAAALAGRASYVTVSGKGDGGMPARCRARFGSRASGSRLCGSSSRSCATRSSRPAAS
jgi:ABC-type amino acid transport system permease subunit